MVEMLIDMLYDALREQKQIKKFGWRTQYLLIPLVNIK